MTTAYSFRTKITSIKEHFEAYNWRMEPGEDGKKVPVCNQRSIGWYVMLEGSRESLYVGDQKPELAEGQKVTISIVPTKEVGDSSNVGLSN